MYDRPLIPTLAPYIYRVAITNNRIEKLENHQVSFRFKNSVTDQWETKTLPAFDFIYRFLQHVLPKGFVKIRYYGFLSPNKRNLLAVAKSYDYSIRHLYSKTATGVLRSLWAEIASNKN